MKVKLSEIEPFTDEQLDSLSRGDLLVVARTYLKIATFLEGYVNELEEKVIEIEGKFFRIRSKLFSPSSEKSPSSNKAKEPDSKQKSAITRLPSERYPNAEIIDKHITFEEEPECKCCGSTMHDSGMTETSEYLTRIPAKFIIVRQHRHKYRCGKCHGDIVTTPAIPRVVPGSSYSDELITDATLSKYCDLIPMERYCQMAKRQGFPGLPPHSLIGASIKLAFFSRIAYERLRQETLDTLVLLGDETTHKMLEGDEKTSWFLWGFLSLSKKSCFYECHDTRSGDVASIILEQSNCEVLLTDAYSGYGKAIREANEARRSNGQALIKSAYCNSHARREFLPPKGQAAPAETQFMIDQYKEIYRLEALAKDQPDEKILEIRQESVPIFALMREHAAGAVNRFSSKSAMAGAFNYFLKYFENLTLFLSNPLIPIDNNPSERLLRSPVVGRKTWYGTHSRDGAEAAAIHFSLIEACKLNNVNPRTYYADLIRRIHEKKPILTPKEFLNTQINPLSTNSS